MSDINPTFSLYHRTLRQPSSGICSIIGNFSGSNKKSQEIVRATQTTLELWKFNKTTNEILRLVAQNSYSNVRTIASFHSIETSKDLILLTSDSGMLSIIEYDPIKNKFISIKNETYYKTGISRLSPGEYICVDPKGRAAMLTAIEKNKLVYPFSKVQDNLSVMSPIEANRSHFLTYYIVAMDTGYDNPIFASIESDYNNNSSAKVLNYYEFDQSLNHVILKETETINHTSNHLIPIPGGLEGPSGVLLCSEGMIQYKCPFKPTHNIPIPTRQLKDGKAFPKSVIIASIVHKMKNDFFILLQNQYGDLFKITLDYVTPQETRYDVINTDVGPGMVTSIKIRYFDTIPICNTLLILKSGYLYADSQNGDCYVYQFEKLGISDDEKEWNSEEYPDELSVIEEEEISLIFEPRKPENINLVSIKSCLNPLMDMKSTPGDFLSTLPELYSITGTGPRSTIKILHKNIPLSEIVTQELPSKIMKAFTCKIHKTDEFDKFIILSFFDGSIILSIGDEVEEAENSGFLDTVTTLDVFQVGNSSIVQIHATGLKQIFYSESDEPIKSIDWNPPPGIEIIFSTCTNNQVAIALSSGDVVYFEVSPNGGSDALIEYSLHKEFNSSITSISIGDIPKGRIRAPFIVVTCKDSTVHILSTDPKNTLEVKFTGKLYGIASSTAQTSYISKIEDYDEYSDEDQLKSLQIQKQVINYVHVGLQNGVYVRYELTNEGELIKPNMKFIMACPLKIVCMKVTNKSGESMSLATINAFLTFFVVPQPNDDIKLVPLPIAEKFVESDDENEEVEYSKTYGCAVPLHSADVPQGIILAHGDKLTIASIPLFSIVDEKYQDVQFSVINKLQTLDNIESIPMRYTPRAICEHPDYKMSYIGCSDSNISSIFQNSKEKQNDEIMTYGNIEDDKHISNFEEAQIFGYPENENSSCSCIHVYSTENSAIGQTIELLDSQSICRISTAMLEHEGNVGDYLLVSTIKMLNPKKGMKIHGECYIRVYHIEEDGSLKYLYNTEFSHPVLAMRSFQGRVVVGFGDEIGIYELGKLQMLRKSGLKMGVNGVTNIVDIQTSGFRLYVSDIRSSVQIVVYDINSNILVQLVDDTINRHITRSLILDHDTVIVGDKFGTLTVLRNPIPDLEVEKFQQMNKKIRGGVNYNNTWNDRIKFDMLMSFYVGDVITGLFRGKIGIGGEEVVLYTGINGTIGSLEAMKTIKEVNFFIELEKLIRKVLQGLNIGESKQHDSKIENNSLMIVDRDILKFRSYYVPKKSCIDGDVVEEFFNLDEKMKILIATQLERSVQQVEERIIEIRNRVGY
ncbi:pre-mRNA-splicing factor rse1 [Pichia californica]|nr:pre-mRNA-splicing factor rse1 [[Candida] californica]